MNTKRPRLRVWLCVCSVSTLVVSGIELQGQSRLSEKKDAISVADAVEMTRLADESYFTGAPSTGRVAHFSPDGKRFSVLLRKGVIQNNTNEFSLFLFETSEAFQSEKPRPLITFSSSSNRDAIKDVSWLDDNESIAFLGENGHDLPQIYKLNTRTRQLLKLTRHPTAIKNFAITANGGDFIFVAESPRMNVFASEQSRRSGFVVMGEYLQDLLAGDCAEPAWGSDQLFVQHGQGVPVQVPVKDGLTDRTILSISPDGQHALIGVFVREVPRNWALYPDKNIQTYVSERLRPGQLSSGFRRYLSLDLKDRSLTPVLNTPMFGFHPFVWSKDGQSVILSEMYLPLDPEDPAELEERRTKTHEVVVGIQDGRYRVAAQRPSSAPVNGSGGSFSVTLEEDLNTPPKIYIHDATTGRKALLLDPNPQFAKLSFGKVEVVKWKTADGREAQGGLYYPPDFVQNRRYPLVIQTHGFKTGRFSMDGFNDWGAGFAARSLAARGFLVLQSSMYADNTPQEGLHEMRRYEGAIDYLDERGLIERHNMGIIGFSRGFYEVGYTLTHSNYDFAAAVLADGIDAGYFSYLSREHPGYLPLIGDTPFHEGLRLWIENSPTFSLSKMHTPVRLEAHGLSTGILGLWEWFEGLSQLSKPVELIYLPDAPHLIVKPWEQIVSEQGIVDWFRFWLKDEEDSDPAKREQYLRWRALKKSGFALNVGTVN